MSRIIDFTTEQLARIDALENKPASKWEYMKRWGSPWLDVVTLNELGAEGWELCGVISAGVGVAGWLFFKRQVKP